MRGLHLCRNADIILAFLLLSDGRMNCSTFFNLQGNEIWDFVTRMNYELCRSKYKTFYRLLATIDDPSCHDLINSFFFLN